MAMPALSPTMKQGNIASWHKKEGDQIKAGEVLADVETDKATVAFEAVEEGYLAKILIPAGTKDVQVGTLVAIVVDDPKDIAAFKDFAAASAASKPAAAPTPAAAAPPPPPPAAAAADAQPAPAHTKMAMPALSPTMKQGNIASWHKKEGDQIKAGEVLADVETDKATVAFEAIEEGYLAKILIPAGTKDVQVGTLVAIVVDDPKDIAAFKNYSAASASTPAASAAAAKPATPSAHAAPPAQPAPAASAPSASPSAGGVRATPAAKKLAAEKNIDLKQVTGTGPNPRIVRADVDEFAPPVRAEAAVSVAAVQTEKPAAAAAAGVKKVTAEGYRDIPLSNIRQIIAKRLLESKTTIPHYYLTSVVNMDKVGKVRAEFNRSKGGVKLSVNDFIIKAVALACKKVPAVNSAWMGGFIRQYDRVDVSVAVSTDTGLITPIVFGADSKGLTAISQNVKELAAKARANKLQPEEFIGGTVTVSNLGMYGVRQFSAIINPPQSAILAIGSTEHKVVPLSEKEAAASGEKFAVSSFMTVTLSADHRVIDGAVGAQWLQSFKDYLENPINMLL